MGLSVGRLAAAFVLSIGAPAQAGPRTFTGTIRLEFPSATTPIEWAVPIAGVGKYQPGTATSTQEAFVLSNTHFVTLGTSTSVMGSVPNLFLGGGAFNTGQVNRFELQGAFIPVVPSGQIFGLRLGVASLDLGGLTGSGMAMTWNHPLFRVGTFNAISHPGALYYTASSSSSPSSATGFDSSWSATVHSLGFGGGDLNVVTPVSLSTSGGGIINGQAKLELTFAPEPAAALMFLAGAGTLCLLGRGRNS